MIESERLGADILGMPAEDAGLDTLVALIYGSRARLRDLQATADREIPERAKLMGDANRFMRRVDERVFRLAGDDPSQGWALFDAIKATHNGAVQHLSQQLRDRLPDRSALN